MTNFSDLRVNTAVLDVNMAVFDEARACRIEAWACLTKHGRVKLNRGVLNEQGRVLQ